MWTYRQQDGALISPGGETVAHGYSGSGEGKNNPQLQDVSNVGPIPRGLYTVLFPRTTIQHGPYVLPLVPASSNEMFGRSGFLMHGDSIAHPGTASQGCIIQSRDVRTQVWSSNDHQLTVVL
jgi:hypothetical protein